MYDFKDKKIAFFLWKGLFVAQFELNILGFENTLSRLLKTKRNLVADTSKKDIIRMIKLARIAYRTAAYFPWRADCLPRSISLFKILRSQGYNVDLYIGVKRPTFEAHAWVQSGGTLISDTSEFIRPYNTIWSTKL